MTDFAEGKRRVPLTAELFVAVEWRVVAAVGNHCNRCDLI